MTELEKAIHEQSEKLNIASCAIVTEDDQYSGTCWFWSKTNERFMSTEESYLSARLRKEPYFKSKESAKKYKSAKSELFRLISIQMDKCIEDSLRNIEDIASEKYVDEWRKENWHEKEW